MKRKGKFYYKNEKNTLKSLGLIPAPQSGAGWIVKEDGENERCMVQLKSTDASSYRIDMLDIKKLEYHAGVSNKMPIFLIQFLKQNRLYALIDVEDLNDINEIFLKSSPVKKQSFDFCEDNVERKKIISNKKSRDKFYEEKERGKEKWKKK